MDELNKLHDKLLVAYKTTELKQNEVIVRIVSVTDFITKQQLQEEYEMINNQLNSISNELENLKKSYITQISVDMLDDMCLFYKTQFEEVSLVGSLKAQGIDLLAVEKKNRLKPIRDISQKRELCMLASILNAQIKIIDCQGQCIDYIGKSAPTIIYLRINTIHLPELDVPAVYTKKINEHFNNTLIMPRITK